MSSNNSFHCPQLAATSGTASRRTVQNNEHDDSNGLPAAAAASVAAPTPPPATSAATTSLENPSDDDDAPVPPAQTAATYEEMEDAIKESIENTQSDDAPLRPTQIAAAYEEIDNAMNDATTNTNKGKPEIIEDGDAPLPAAMKSEEIFEVNESLYDNDASKKPPTSLTNQGLRQGQDDVTVTVPLSSPVPQVGYCMIKW